MREGELNQKKGRAWMTLSEAGEEMEVGNSPEQKPVERDFTTQELPQDLSGTIGRTQPHHP